MDISTIATREYAEASPDTRLGTLRSTLEDETVGGVLVTEDGDCLGVIQPRDLVGSRIDDDTEVGGQVHRVPTVERDADVREVARLLVENQTRVAPVLDGGTLWGSVTAEGILEAVRENLDVLSVEEIQTDEVVSVTGDTDVGTVINRLREHSVSRLPVVEEDGTLAGIVTTDDLVEFIVDDLDQQRQTTGDRAGDQSPMLDLPVSDVSSRPVVTTTPDASVADAVGKMLENESDGLVVTPDYSDLVAGVLTKTDVLRALTYTEEEHMDVQVTNLEMLQTTAQDELRERIESVSEKYQDMHVLHAHVRLHEHDEELRGRPLSRCKIQLRTDEEQVASTGEAYGADEALSLALDKLERNVIELKGKRSDEEYHGQLLRKLNEL